MAASALFRDKWKETRGAITLLRHTVRRAKPGGGTGVETDKVRARSIAELLADPSILEPPKVIAPRLAWANRTTLFAGREKWSGKSTILTAAACAVSNGGAFLAATATGPADVLWLSADLEPEADIVQRVHRFKGDPTRIHVLYPRAKNFDARLEELEGELERIKPSWLIVDTMAHYAMVEESGQAAGWIETMIPLRKIAQRFGCAVTLVHHTPKGSPDEYRDSTAIGGAVDQVIIYKAPDRADPRREVIGRGRIVGWQPFDLKLEGDDFVLIDAPPPGEVQLLEVVIRAVRAAGVDGSTAVRDLVAAEARAHGFTSKEVKDNWKARYLHQAIQSGRIREVDGDRGKKILEVVVTPESAMDANEER